MAHDDRPISKRLSEHDDRGAGADERRRDVAEAVVYLRSRRIEIPEDESPHGVVRLLSAVQQFENAVKERGGVVMIAGVTSRRTSKTRFMLPLGAMTRPSPHLPRVFVPSPSGSPAAPSGARVRGANRSRPALS